MAEYVYVGRRRRPGWMVLWQLLTLGVYGRVWLYKTLRELDGHGTLFLDRRLYLPLLILPFIGPFIVKRRVAHLTHHLLHHEITAPGLRLRGTVALGLLPLAPVLHVIVQRALNHHWKMHTKEEELAIRSAELDRQRRRAKTSEAQAELRSLEAEVDRRQKELDDLRSAAVALREAEAIRLEAEAEMKSRPDARVGTVRKFLSVARSRARPNPSPGADAPEEEPAPAEQGQEEPERAPAPEAGTVPEGEAAPNEPRSLMRFLPKLRRGDPAEREARKAEKAAQKERRRAEKAAARDAKAAEKPARDQDDERPAKDKKETKRSGSKARHPKRKK